MSRLTDFYRGRGTDSEGRTLAELWSFSDEQTEITPDTFGYWEHTALGDSP